MEQSKILTAFKSFDDYNSKDPNMEVYQGKEYPKELLYALRMTNQLNLFVPDAAEHIQLAARCQHIGRWEIPRNSYPMDKKGYLLWRSTLKQHHAKVAENILQSCGYEGPLIDKVKFLLEKRELKTNQETQIIEDIVCLVFVEYYLEDFAAKHEDLKVIEILRKTLNKMSPKAIDMAKTKISSSKIMSLISEAAS